MNAIVKQIEELKRNLSYIHFKDHLSNEDYERINMLAAEIKRLQDSLKGTEGVAVKLTSKDGGYSFYLTEDDILCCGDEPTLFEDQAEAEAYLNKAHLNVNEYDVEFIKTTY